MVAPRGAELPEQEHGPVLVLFAQGVKQIVPFEIVVSYPPIDVSPEGVPITLFA